jgi:phage terminase small subunit
MALNPKQSLFVKEYLIDGNASRAAKAAGYSVKTAGSQGHDLLKKPEIASEIKKGLDARKAQLERKAAQKGLTKERWLEELRLIALSNMDDFITIEEMEVRQGSRGKKYLETHVRATKTHDRKRSLGRVIKKISETKNGIGIELHSKQAALETLGRAYGWVKDAVDLNLPQVDSVQVVLTMPANGREAPPETTHVEVPEVEGFK